MKNIHLLPTNEPSRLFKDDNQVVNLHTHPVLKGIFTNEIGSNQHIYITSSEEIKEGDWIYKRKGIYETIQKTTFPLNLTSVNKKIILTTDPKLITDGVQAIDDEFLQWFVNNPICEYVDQRLIWNEKNLTSIYKIVIPKEETIENIAKQIQNDCHKFVESIPNVTHQDATNVFLFMKLAELTLKLKKYEQ